jgi:2-polyprenyl-3-methyl-5-hydroxy-6-metoxy-1,4-benzoquinol methylase
MVTDETDMDAFTDRVMMAALGWYEMLTVQLGERFGCYERLAEGPATADELAAAVGIAPRYAVEWLEQQASAGLITVVAEGAGPADRLYGLSAAQRAVLTEPGTSRSLVPLVLQGAAMAATLPQLVDAFRTGAGVPYAAYGERMRRGIELENRPLFLDGIADWVMAVPGLDARLREHGCRVADVGCGAGWSAIALARAYPSVAVDGFDLDDASVGAARRHVEEAGLSSRVSVQVRDARDPGLAGRYQLVCVFETLHDMGDPSAAVAACRSLVADDGVVLIADMAADDDFAAPGDELQRFLYAFSVLHCLPVGIADAPTPQESAATGTVMRPATLARLAADAGFATVAPLEVAHDKWRFWALQP